MVLICNWPTQRHNLFESSTIRETITYTHRTSFWPNITKFQTRNVGTIIWRTNFIKWYTLQSILKKRKTYHHQRWCTLSTLLLRSWQSQSLTVTFGWTLTQSVLTIIAWNSWQAARHFQNDARNSKKVLLPFNSNIRQKLGSWLWNLHSRQTHKQDTNQPRIYPHPRMGSRTRRSHANSPISRITTNWRLRENH